MKTHEEIERELDNLFDLSRGCWSEHPTYPIKNWKYEVTNDDTRLGYRSWLYNQLANEESGVVGLPTGYKRQHTGDCWYCPSCEHEWLAFEGEIESHCPQCGTYVEEDR